jgi:hypothetical protein
MRKGLLVIAALAVLAPLGAASPADGKSRPGHRAIVGIGDQKIDFFTDPRLRWLNIRKARLVVPWFLASSGSPEEIAYVDTWLRAARKAGVEPMVSFGHGFIGWTRRWLPTHREFVAAYEAFRERWPWVKVFITWNETNHCSQPTCHKPRRAARFYDAMVDRCRGCTIVAAALIDQPNMVTWLRRFQRAARHRIKVLGLHNYLDVNRLRTKGTRRLLRAYKGRIWITETGGLVYRRHYKGQAAFPESVKHAGRANRFALRVTTRLSSRIERIYLYHWNVDRPKPTWDSGLIDWRGVARPGYRAVVRFLGKKVRRSPGPYVRPVPPPPVPPGLEEPPPAESQKEPPPPSEEPPPEEQPPCPLLVLCPGGLYGSG